MMDNVVANGAIKKTVGGDPKTMEQLRAEIVSLADELEGPAPTPIERALAETATLCWFSLRAAQLLFDSAGELTIGQAAFQERKLDHCHRRYLSTLRTLATVRKLALPAIQLNIAKEQVNISGG